MRDSRTLVARVKRLEEASDPELSESAKMDKYLGLLAEFGTPPKRIAEHRDNYRRNGEDAFWEWLMPGEASWVLGRVCLDDFPEWEGRTPEDLWAAADAETDEVQAGALRAVGNLLWLRDPAGKTCRAYGAHGQCGQPAVARNWWFAWVCSEHVRSESAPGAAN